jgi:anti-anti-sigma factor
VNDPFVIQGDLDMATAIQVGADLIAYATATDGDVVIDCSAMTFIDSSGIRAMLNVHRSLANQDRRLIMRNVNRRCRRPIDITGLGELFGLDTPAPAPDPDPA